MTRVADVPPDDLAPGLRDVYQRFAGGYASFRNQAGVLAHVPSAAQHLMAMLLELREQRNLPYRYTELAIVTVSKLNECSYCVAHHTPLLQVEGLSAAGVANVLDYADHPELTAIDKLVVEYAIAVTRTPQRIGDTMFERLRAAFTEAQLVELTLRIALCGFFNRFNDALQIDAESEPVAGTRAHR